MHTLPGAKRIPLVLHNTDEVVGWCDLDASTHDNLASLLLAGSKIEVHGSLRKTNTNQLLSLSFVPVADQQRVK